MNTFLGASLMIFGLLSILNAIVGLAMRKVRLIPFVTRYPKLEFHRRDGVVRFYGRLMSLIIIGLGLVSVGAGLFQGL